jgi:hypothetical protein
MVPANHNQFTSVGSTSNKSVKSLRIVNMRKINQTNTKQNQEVIVQSQGEIVHLKSKSITEGAVQSQNKKRTLNRVMHRQIVSKRNAEIPMPDRDGETGGTVPAIKKNNYFKAEHKV